MMAKNSQQHPTLGRPAVYQSKVPGHLDKGGMDWGAEMLVETGHNPAGLPITTLSGTLDQAALLGLLRRLYSLGLPLISVNCLEVK